MIPTSSQLETEESFRVRVGFRVCLRVQTSICADVPDMQRDCRMWAFAFRPGCSHERLKCDAATHHELTAISLPMVRRCFRVRVLGIL